jgi:RHS repeat-associated protein
MEYICHKRSSFLPLPARRPCFDTLSTSLGSTGTVTFENGNLVSQTKYKAWGEVRHQSGVTPTEYGFTGQFRHEDEFGLLFYVSRYYDPSLGRFTSPDTIIPKQSQGVQAWDRYAYVNNSPINYTDPTGHCLSGTVLDTIACVGLLLIFSSMSDTEQHLSPQEIESRKDTFEVGATILSLPMAIKYPIVEFASNIYDCATSAPACATTFAPGSTSAYADSFVSVSPSEFDSSINKFGLLTSRAEELSKRIWLTKLKYIDDIADAREFESVLYNSPLSIIKKEDEFFSSGATIRLVDVGDAKPAGLTNMTNGVPQWFVTRNIPASNLKIIKKVRAE